jgi:cell division protein FtsA
MKGIITGIDVGSSKITTVIVNVDEENISVIGVSTHPSEGLKKGVIINIDEAIKAISESVEAAERMAGVRIQNAVISLGCKHISSTNNKGVVAISRDEISGEDVLRALDSARTVSVPQSREIMHVIPREFIVDSQGGIKDPIGMSGIRLEVDTHIITITSMVLHNLTKCINQVGLSVEDILFSGWIDAEVILSSTEKELGVILIDIGFGVSDVVIYVDDAIVYSFSVPIGGSNITNDIAIGLRLSIDDAEKVKTSIPTLVKKAQQRQEQEEKDKKYAYPKKETSDIKEQDLMLNLSDIGIQTENGYEEIKKSMLDDIIDARLEEIFGAIIDDVTKSGFDYKMPAGVVLTGGGAKLAGISRIAQKYFSSAARVGYASNLKGLTEEISGPAYTTVYGLINSVIKNSNDGSRNSSAPGKSGNGFNASKIIDLIKSIMP